MTTEKIYGPWIKWHGGTCPVPLDTLVEVKLRSGNVMGPRLAYRYRWKHIDSNGDIVEYCTITEQLDLEAAEKLLRANGYTVIPPAMTAADLIAALQRLPQHLPVKVLLGTVDDGYGNISYLREGDALPVDSVRQSGGYILIKGD